MIFGSAIVVTVKPTLCRTYIVLGERKRRAGKSVLSQSFYRSHSPSDWMFLCMLYVCVWVFVKSESACSIQCVMSCICTNLLYVFIFFSVVTSTWRYHFFFFISCSSSMLYAKHLHVIVVENFLYQLSYALVTIFRISVSSLFFYLAHHSFIYPSICYLQTVC